MKPWTLLLLLVTASALGAEKPVPREADFVEVYLDGDGCRGAPEVISVVIVGSDQSYSAHRDGDKWVWHATPPLRFDLNEIRAYVRFDKRRTDYQKRADYRHRTLTFRFPTCVNETVQDVEVRAADKAKKSVDIDVRYERTLHDFTTPATLPEDKTIPAVWFAKEALSLQLAWSKEASDIPRLLVASPNGKGRPVFIVFAGREGDEVIPDPTLWRHPDGLLIDDILHAMDVQENPLPELRWSPSARSAEQKRLHEQQVEVLRLTWKK